MNNVVKIVIISFYYLWYAYITIRTSQILCVLYGCLFRHNTTALNTFGTFFILQKSSVGVQSSISGKTEKKLSSRNRTNALKSIVFFHQEQTLFMSILSDK